MVVVMIGNKWDEILKNEFEKTYFKQLMEFVDNEYKTKTNIIAEESSILKEYFDSLAMITVVN